MRDSKVVVAIIDSGYSKFVEDSYHATVIAGHSMVDDAKDSDIYSDEFGHGSAVAELIADYSPEALFYIVKAFARPGVGGAASLIRALEYIEENVECDIVHVSAGVRSCLEMGRLIKVINKLNEKGVVIVAAFDNAGALSYPASLKGVVGVDIASELRKKGEFEYVEGDIISVRMPDIFYRIKWKEAKTLERGSSFACTSVTALLANRMMEKGRRFNHEMALDVLRAEAKQVRKQVEYPKLPDSDDMARSIVRAVAFPFNKEMFSVAKYEEMLRFESIEYYDSRLSSNIGRRICEILPYTDNEKIVRSIDELDWKDGFDTFILGHIDQYEAFDEHFGEKIIKKCEEYNKRIFSFGNITKYYDLKSEFSKNIAFPYIDASNMLQNRFGKLRQCAKPVLMVCGTSSKQGKFSLQMELRKEFEKNQYHVFQVSTEPFGALLGADRTFPMGHDSTVYTDSKTNISVLNEMLFDAEMEDAEIVLTGLQSQSAPLAYFNMSFLPIQQMEMFYGMNPDVIVLVVNGNDDIQYIKRTKALIESATRGKVIALAMLPSYLSIGNTGVMSQRKLFSEGEIDKIREIFLAEIGLNTYLIGDELELSSLFKCIIDFF